MNELTSSSFNNKIKLFWIFGEIRNNELEEIKTQFSYLKNVIVIKDKELESSFKKNWMQINKTSYVPFVAYYNLKYFKYYSLKNNEDVTSIMQLMR